MRKAFPNPRGFPNSSQAKERPTVIGEQIAGTASPTCSALFPGRGFGACAGFAGPPFNARKLLLGGEALPAQLCQKYVPARAVTCSILRPTETTVWSAVKRVMRLGTASLSAGRSRTRQFTFWTKISKPCPSGRPEKISSGGEACTGLLGASRLTAERFLPIRSAKPITRGFIEPAISGRFRSDGTIEFLGRLIIRSKFADPGRLGELNSARGHPAVSGGGRPGSGGSVRRKTDHGYVVPQRKLN